MHNVNQLMGRTLRFWYIDGLPDLAVGSMLLCVCGLNLVLSFYLPALLPQSLLSRVLLLIVLAISAVLLLLGVFWAIAYVVLQLKTNLTYLRVGYAFPFRRPVVWQHWLFRLLSFEICTALLILTKTLPPTFLQEFPVLFGLFMASMHLYMGYVRDLPRFYLLAAVSLVLVVGLLFARMDTVLGFEFYSSLMGMIEMLSGCITLWIFLRQNPPLSQEIL
ncbi:hypothetical protein [Scytonema sp. PCC 10023]|uniref:hypothetical protein n=1 Tax=Scytonema sp. PCC 10023 TaxID=1680591 RepID=UPI0039C5C54D